MGRLYEANCYLIQYEYGSDDAKKWVIYYWIGRLASSVCSLIRMAVFIFAWGCDCDSVNVPITITVSVSLSVCVCVRARLCHSTLQLDRAFVEKSAANLAQQLSSDPTAVKTVRTGPHASDHALIDHTGGGPAGQGGGPLPQHLPR